jgi:predicted exporter
MTMLGVCDDYPILLVTNGRAGERLRDTARRIWPTLRLAVAAAVAGLAPMLASGLPGLAQLGLFAASGLLAAALTTRFLLPRLVPDAGIRVRDLPTGFATALLRLNRHRGVAILVLAAAGLALLALGGPTAERDLAALSPVPERARLLDEELRGQLGAPDVRTVLVIQAPDAEAALEASERAVAVLAPLVTAGAVGRFDAPSRYLPSIATQRARQAALPDDTTLQARLDAARAGLPFRATAFDPFRASVAESRTVAPLTPDALGAAPLMAARLAPLLQRQGEGWQAVILPGDVRDPAALRSAAAAIPGLLHVDVKAETEAILARQTRLAMMWAAVGAVLVMALLVSGQGLRGGLRIALALGGALLLTVTALTALGERITLFHLAAMLLLAGVSLDYALFMARSDEADPDEAGRALRGVLNCTITTLLTFGLLALCRTPVLHAIGLTVTLGVASAFLLACILAPGRRTA